MPDLRQYVVEEEAEPENAKGPRVIKLDEPERNPEWKPPPNLAIYLSTIELPDLKPGGAGRANSSKRPNVVGAPAGVSAIQLLTPGSAQSSPAMVGGKPKPASSSSSNKPVPPIKPASAPPPKHRPVSPNPPFGRPVSPNPPPPNAHRPSSMGHVGLLNAKPGGRPDRPASFNGPPTSGFQPAPPSGFQPNGSGFGAGPSLNGGYQPPYGAGAPPPPHGPVGGGGGYSENPFGKLGSLFRPNH